MLQTEYKIMDSLQAYHWWYRGRRFLVRMLFDMYMKSQTVLDIGCGTGEGCAILPSSVVLSGVEPNSIARDLAETKGYKEIVAGNAENLPFQDASFEGVLMLDVLEHTDDDQKSVFEFLRVLQPEGVGIITVPAYQWMWSSHDDRFGHRRRYTKKQLEQLVQKTGGEILFSSYCFFTMFLVVVAYRLYERCCKRTSVPHFQIGTFLNSFLYSVLKIETFLLEKGVRFPWGSSVCVVVKKR